MWLLCAHFLAFSEHQDSKRTKNWHFLSESSATSKRPIATLVEKFNSIIIEKSIWIVGYVKISKAFCRFCIIKIPTEWTKSITFLFDSPPQAKSCRLNPWCKKSGLSFWIIMSWKPRSVVNHSWHFRPVRIQTQGKNIDDFSFENSSWSERSRTGTIIKELSQIVIEKSEIQHSTKSKLEIIYNWEHFGKKTFWKTIIN